MTDNVPVRSAISGELIKFRGNGQWGKLNLAIQHAETVYTARINQTFTSTEGTYELTYDGGTGTLTDVLQNMTVFIGSSAGAYDKGICRVRKLPTASKLYISETSDIVFADNDYITIIDHMGIWARDITETSDVVMMDYDIEFGSSLHGGVIPRIGPLAAVLNLTGATVNFTPPSSALSASYDGTTIDGILWEAPGASATADMDTVSPTFTYNAAGEYRYSCSLTDSNGRVTTTYRRLFINPAEINFRLESCVGDTDTGYWSFEVTCFNNVSLSDVYDRALVVLYAKREYYNGVQGSIGKLAGFENIKCVGWIEGESISYNSESGDVTFTVQGPGFWLDKVRAFPFELIDTSAAPANWKQIQQLTVDKALAHILFWTSTAPTVMDCFFTGNTTRIKSLGQPSGSLLDQLNAIALDKLFAKPLFNNYGQMFIEIDQQVLPSGDRDALTVVMDITNDDWIGERDIVRNTNSRTSMVELSAYSNYDGTTQGRVYSRAPGKNPKRHGSFESLEDYLVVDQDECNRISGDLLAFYNYEFEPFDVKLRELNHLIDIAPRMYCTTTITAAENPRGVALTDVRIIPRRIELDFDKKSGTYLPTITFEVETIGVPGVTYYPIDINGDDDTDLDIDDIDDFPGDDDDFPDDPIDVGTPCIDAVSNVFSLGWDMTELRGEDPTKLSAKAYFPCVVRAAGSLFETEMALPGTFFGDAPTHYNVYGILGGSRIITGTVTHNKSGNSVHFSPLTDTAVDGFEVALEAGLGTELEFVVGAIIETGTVQATDDAGDLATQLEVGNYYSLNAWGGPWKKTSTWPNEYDFIAGNGALQTGATGIGLASINSTDTEFHLDMGSMGVYAYAINTLYGLVIFQATAAAVGFVVADGYKADNTGSLGYTLRDVTANGRRILLGGATLHNVCAIE